MSQAITQKFDIEIVRTNHDGEGGHKIAPALSLAVTQWEREFNEEDDEAPDEEFLVDDTDDARDDDDDDGHDGDGPEYEVEVSDSTLTLTLPATVEALAEIKALQAMDADERLAIRFVYGDGALTRQFTISPDVAIVLAEGNRVDLPNEPLSIQVVADIYESETIF